MKKIITFLLFLVIGLMSCKNESSTEPPKITSPTVITTAVTNITATSAKSGGNVTSDGNSTITARGVCWSTTLTPTITNNKTTDGTGTGLFVSTITGLNPGTTYYIRAYATNGAGTNYGSEISFTTSTQLIIGDSYKKGIVIEIHLNNGEQHGLLAAPVDLTPTWGAGFDFFTAMEAAAKYGEGYRLPDSTEMKLVKNAKNLGILTNFVDPNYDSRGIYFTSTEMTGNTDWVFYIGMHENFNGWINKGSSVSSRAVRSF